jgi:hypothetical protein
MFVRRTTCDFWFLPRRVSSFRVCGIRRNLIANRTTHSFVVNMVKESSEEYRILKSALESKTDPIEAATAFTKPTRDAFVTGRSEQPQLESYFWKAWASVTHLATETPHEEQEPLVEIVRAIQKQNVTDSEVTTEIEIWNAKMKLWQDMPLFGAQAREKWNRSMYILLPPFVDKILILDSAWYR